MRQVSPTHVLSIVKRVEKRAPSVVCPGCERECVMAVHALQRAARDEAVGREDTDARNCRDLLFVVCGGREVQIDDRPETLFRSSARRCAETPRP